MKKKKLFTIFKSVALYSNKEYEECSKGAKEFLSELYEENEITDDMITDELYHDEELNYGAEKQNLDKVLYGNIIAIADCGLWNGRRHGIKLLGKNLNNILTNFDCDYMNVYATRRGVYGEFYHHDGTHYVEFRELKDTSINDEYEITFDTENRNSISRHTKNLSPYVNEVYGCFK